jgi:hypothetical protein
MNTTTTKKRGGPQPGSGRPPKPEADKVVKCNISMTAAHHAATAGDRAGMIRRALDGVAYWRTRCELAEAFIEESPCDPDVTKAQAEAYQEWKAFAYGCFCLWIY